MSDVGRYRRAYPRLFRHPDFKALPPLGQRLVCYLLFGPQSNRIGCFYFSINTAAEDLDTSADSLRQALRKLALRFGWSYDASNRVVYIPSWWRWNPPDHVKVLQGNLKDLHELPPCGLVDAFAANLTYLKPDLHETFLKAIGIAIPKATPSQYQDQDQYQEQEQKSGAARRGQRTKTVKTSNEPSIPATGPLVSIAHETLKITNPDGPIEELIDTCQWLLNQRNPTGNYPRADVVAALNVAISERRAS